MPNLDSLYFCYSTGTSASSQSSQSSQAQQQFEGYVRERELQDRIIEQIICEEEQRIEDRKRYPLFFWRELAKEKK